MNLTVLSQTTDSSRSNKLDLVKTIQQNEIMREEIVLLREKLKIADSLIKSDSLIKMEQQKLLKWYQIKSSLNDSICDLDKINLRLQGEIDVLKMKNKKFVLGPCVGYGLTNEMKLQPFIGLSLTYSMLRF